MAAAGFRIGLAGLACAACTSIAADARTFDSTRWHVTAINGHATPATGDYRIEFNDGGIGGRFGCNAFGGRYAIVGDLMTSGEIRSTLMGCSDPAASFERQGFAVLHLPMRMIWRPGHRLTLGNGAGTITLEQIG